MKAMVFGGMDGIITVFSVVASVNGANLSTSIIFVLGFANLIAAAISMGFGEYVGDIAEKQFIAHEREREMWEFENCPEVRISVCACEGEIKKKKRAGETRRDKARREEEAKRKR